MPGLKRRLATGMACLPSCRIAVMPDRLEDLARDPRNHDFGNRKKRLAFAAVVARLAEAARKLEHRNPAGLRMAVFGPGFTDLAS